MAKLLVVIAGKDKGRRFTLPDTGNFSIGRGNTTRPRLTDVRLTTHCELQTAGDQLKIIDAKSAVGTFVNNRPSKADATSKPATSFASAIPSSPRRRGSRPASHRRRHLGSGTPRRSVDGEGRRDRWTAERPRRLHGRPLSGQRLAGSRRGDDRLSRSQTPPRPAARPSRCCCPRPRRPTAKCSAWCGAPSRLPLRQRNLMSLYCRRQGSRLLVRDGLVEGENLTPVFSARGMAGMLNWDHALADRHSRGPRLVELDNHASFTAISRRARPHQRQRQARQARRHEAGGARWTPPTPNRRPDRPTCSRSAVPAAGGHARRFGQARRTLRPLQLRRHALRPADGDALPLRPGPSPRRSPGLAETAGRPRVSAVVPTLFENIVLRLLAKKPPSATARPPPSWRTWSAWPAIQRGRPRAIAAMGSRRRPMASSR